MSQENLVCPLCMECLDVDDHTFIPCTCGYQICRFCWHRIKTVESGTCPACRKTYTEGPAQFQPLSTTELQEIKKKQKLKESEEKKKSLEKCNKYFANARVIQKNLMFVVGLPPSITDSEVLRRQEYFGKFGKITKITLTKMTPPMGNISMTTTQQNGNNTSTYQFQSAYVMFARIEDTLRAIKSINSLQVQLGKNVKASLGTTKYCSRFIKGLQCLKPECMYLHETVDDEACFTKEEIQQGKHTTYEQKLYVQYCKDEPTPRTPSPNTQNSSLGGQKQATCKQSQSKTIASTPTSHKKPLDHGQINCWKLGGAAIVKASLATPSSPVANQRNPQIGTLIATQKNSVDSKACNDENNKIEDKNINGRLSPVVRNDRNPSTSSSNDGEKIDEDFERLSYLSGRTSNEGDLDSYSGEANTRVSPQTNLEMYPPSTDEEEEIGAFDLGLEDLKEEITEPPREVTPEPDFLHGFKEDIKSSLRQTPPRNFYDDVASTPAAKGVVLPSVLDVSDIEADLADLKVDDHSSASLDCSRDDDRHDDDIDPWKIVSIGLDLLENERILEERPHYSQTTSYHNNDGSSLLVSCGLQSLRENNRMSQQYDLFNSNSNNHNDSYFLVNNSDFLDTAVRNNYQQQRQLEEMLLQRRHQHQRLLMLQQQAMRSPTYPSASDSYFGQDALNYRANQSMFRLQDQHQPLAMLGQSNGHQQQHQQQYLYLQQQRQQQFQHQQLEQVNQRLQGQVPGLFNGHQRGNVAFVNGQARPQQEQQLNQSMPNEHKRWQDGLKALLPNVNISFGPNPPFVKEAQAPPTSPRDLINGNASMNASFRTAAENINGLIDGSMHDVASLDPAIVNAVANHPSYDENYLMQQQCQYSQLGLNFPMNNYERAHSMQRLPAMNGRPHDWPVLTNGMSELPQLARRVKAVPPPPGFEKMHPQKTDL